MISFMPRDNSLCCPPQHPLMEEYWDLWVNEKQMRSESCCYPNAKALAMSFCSLLKTGAMGTLEIRKDKGLQGCLNAMGSPRAELSHVTLILPLLKCAWSGAHSLTGSPWCLLKLGEPVKSHLIRVRHLQVCLETSFELCHDVSLYGLFCYQQEWNQRFSSHSLPVVSHLAGFLSSVTQSIQCLYCQAISC